MKICVAQTIPIIGDIQGNITNHKKLINTAILQGVGLIVFPELSLTGYEPNLAKALATDKDDERLDAFQKISDGHNIIIGVGIPTKHNAGTCISMVIFQPQHARLVYSKKYLHADEEPFFTSGDNLTCLTVSNTNIALAICYELSIAEHAETASKNGAGVYIASVAKSASGVEKAAKSLSEIASSYSMTVLMSNSVGYCDNFLSAGKSSIWNSDGKLIGQLNNVQEGIVIIDTQTQEVSVMNS